MVHVVEVVPKGVHAVSGVVSSVVELSCALAGLGDEVTVVVPGQSSAVGSAARAHLADRGVACLDVPGNSIVGVAARAARELRDRRPSIIHIHNGFSPFNNALAAAVARYAPFAITTHGVYAPEGMRRSARRKQIAIAVLDRPTLQRAAVVTALTDIEAEEVRDVAPSANVETLPLGFAPPAVVDAHAFRRELGLPIDALLAIYVGRFDIDHKRLDDVVRGLPDRPRWHFACVGGDDGDSPALRSLANRLGVGDRLHLRPARYGIDFEPVLAGGDLAVLLSKSEGLPRGLVQALGHGVPGLISPEVERRLASLAGPTSATGPSRDAAPWWVAAPDAVGDALERIAATDPAARQRNGIAAREWAAQLDWEEVGFRWSALLAAYAQG